MKNKEIFIPISKIKGLDKVNDLDLQIEKISKVENSNVDLENFNSEDLMSESFAVENNISSDSAPNKSVAKFNFTDVPSVEDNFIKINLKSFLDVLEASDLELDSIASNELIVNSKFLMDLINSRTQKEDLIDSNQLLKGVLIGVFVSIFLFLLVKLI